MRIAFAGSPRPAAVILRHLAASEHEVALVISQPDRRRGRSGVVPTPAAQEAEALGIPCLRPDTINDPEVVEAIRAADVGALCVVAFGQLVREPILSEWPCVNVHFSILPAYRGAAPVERAIMDGATETGVTIMRMEAGLDTGPIASVTRTPVTEDDDAGSVVARLSELGGPALVEALSQIAAGRFAPTPQPEEGVSIAPKITDEDRALDFGRPAREVVDRIRALSPHIGAQAVIDGERFKIWRARVADAAVPAGLSVEGSRLLAGCDPGAIEILELQPPSRARMRVPDFLRGWRGALELGR